MKNKRGQVTVFVIIAIVIVILGLVIYTFFPKLKISSEFDVNNPEAFIQSCVKEELESTVDLLSKQGGSLNPEHYYLYMDDKLEYLCYTNEDYELCAVQRPFLRDHIESEINRAIKNKVNECFDSLKEKYEKKAYSVNLKKGTVNTELLPERIRSNFINYRVVAVKEENSEEYKSFSIVLNNNLYELISIATNIIKWEATIGEADVYNYMMLYNYLKIEKLEQIDGTKVYILINKEKNNKFQFASRSLAFPPGF